MDVILCGLLFASGLVVVALGLFRVSRSLDERNRMSENVRVDLHIHLPESFQGHRFDKLEALLHQVLNKENKLMALGQDILDPVTAETTAVDSFIALVQGLIDNNTIPAAVGAAILAQVNTNKDKLNAAIAANTPVNP